MANKMLFQSIAGCFIPAAANDELSPAYTFDSRLIARAGDLRSSLPRCLSSEDQVRATGAVVRYLARSRGSLGWSIGQSFLNTCRRSFLSVLRGAIR